MEALCSCEISGSARTTRHSKPERRAPHSHRCQTVKWDSVFASQICLNQQVVPPPALLRRLNLAPSSCTRAWRAGQGLLYLSAPLTFTVLHPFSSCSDQHPSQQKSFFISRQLHNCISISCRYARLRTVSVVTPCSLVDNYQISDDPTASIFRIENFVFIFVVTAPWESQISHSNPLWGEAKTFFYPEDGDSRFL
jgi:hypothetical protein